mmetsp:Transcript_12295/g.44835  ORF Transcript_12295/g.44835 Transcript_12295/m.44835 type:complete len:734 (-) Transcript_12295:2063-4264(-)
MDWLGSRLRAAAHASEALLNQMDQSVATVKDQIDQQQQAPARTEDEDDYTYGGQSGGYRGSSWQEQAPLAATPQTLSSYGSSSSLTELPPSYSATALTTPGTGVSSLESSGLAWQDKQPYYQQKKQQPQASQGALTGSRQMASGRPSASSRATPSDDWTTLLQSNSKLPQHQVSTNKQRGAVSTIDAGGKARLPSMRSTDSSERVKTESRVTPAAPPLSGLEPSTPATRVASQQPRQQLPDRHKPRPQPNRANVGEVLSATSMDAAAGTKAKKLVPPSSTVASKTLTAGMGPKPPKTSSVDQADADVTLNAQAIEEEESRPAKPALDEHHGPQQTQINDVGKKVPDAREGDKQEAACAVVSGDAVEQPTGTDKSPSDDWASENSASDVDTERQRELREQREAHEAAALQVAQTTLQERMAVTAEIFLNGETQKRQLEGERALREEELRDLRARLDEATAHMEAKKAEQRVSRSKFTSVESELESDSLVKAQELAKSQRQLERVMGEISDLKNSLYLLQMDASSCEKETEELRLQLASRQKRALAESATDSSSDKGVVLHKERKKEIMQLQQELVEGAAAIQAMQKRVMSGKLPEAKSELEMQLEASLDELSDELLHQQAAVEAAMSEKAMYLMRIEATKRGNSHMSGNRSNRGNKIGAREIGTSVSQYAQGLLMPFTSGGKRGNGIQAALATLMDYSAFGGSFLRQHAYARLALYVYLIVLHVWFLFVWYEAY